MECPRLLVIGWICTILLAGCSEANESPDALDRLVPATFVFADEPDVTMGLTKGKAPYLFSGISGATSQSDGTIVVANCLSGELRYFDDEGRFVHAVGGQGNGPGEFSFLRRILRLPGDTIGAFDGFGNRVHIFAPDGDLLRTVPFGPMTPQALDVFGRLSDGSFVARRYDAAPPDETSFRQTVSLLLFDAAGRPVDSLASLPALDAMRMAAGGAIVSARLARTAVLATHPNGIFYGGQDEAGVVEFDTELNQIGVISTITRSEPVTEEARRAFQAMVDGGASQPRGSIGVARGPEYAPMMPAFGDIVWGRDGRLWVQDPFRPGHYPLIWTGYEDGSAVARVELRPRFFPFEFGPGWVLGVSYDDLSVERVQRWRLTPGNLSGHVLPPSEAQPPIAVAGRCGSWTSR